MEYKKLVEQIDERHERLIRLAEQRHEYEQSISRLVRWFDEQEEEEEEQVLSNDSSIP
jgi:lipoate-protein ligase A